MIAKAGFAVVRKGKLLLLRKKGLTELILPGGKPFSGETLKNCLKRELKEELGVVINKSVFAGVFSDRAAGRNETVSISLFLGDFSGKPKASMEIEAMFWVSKNTIKPLSAVVKNKVIPFLVGKGLLK